MLPTISTPCPLCHTAADASAQFAWQCRTCGQRWTPVRLATVDAYATWAKAREQSASTRVGDLPVASV